MGEVPGEVACKRQYKRIFTIGIFGVRYVDMVIKVSDI